MFGRKRHGVAASATVLELGPTPRGARQTGKRDVEYRFKLSLAVDGEAPRAVEHVEPMPALKAPLIGNVIPVFVSGDSLRIDWDNVPDIADRARASAAAAASGDAAGAAAALGFTLRDES